MATKNPSSKTFIFKCDQHQAAIVSAQNEFFDTVLIAGSNSVTIKTHRVVLCGLSEYFFEIFRGDQKALNGNKVELKETEASTLKLVIDFMYSGSIELSVETVEEILRSASFLKIKSLLDGCCKFIEQNIDSSSSLRWFRLGYELSLTNLKTKAQKCIFSHIKEISKEKEFLTLSENELKDLLFNNNHGDFEEDVFLAMVSWLNFDESNRKHLVLQLLSRIRFQSLTPKFIVENRKSVCRTMESYELICSWLQQHTFKLRKNTENKKKLAMIRVSVGGELIMETFNPKENLWSSELELHLPTRRLSYTVVMIDGKLIVAGVIDGSLYSDRVDCLDLHTSEWIDLPLMKKKRCINQMVDLRGSLCVLGLEIDEGPISMEIYNFSTRQWNYLEPLAQLCFKVKIATHNEMLYLLDFGNSRLQYYNVSSNKWTLKTIERQPVRSYSLAAFEGCLYISGGFNELTDEWVSTVKCFNLSNDSWCSVASMPGLISVSKSIVFENKIIVCSSCTAFEYYPDSNTWNTLSAFNSQLLCYDFNICSLASRI